MIEVIKHGMNQKTPYVFECASCGCIYRSTEYMWNREYGYVSKCPECNKNNDKRRKDIEKSQEEY